MHHFRAYAPERIQYGYDRYTNEAGRLYGVLDARLDGRDYVAAGEYTIADFANVKRWFEAIAARPAVAGDMEKLEDKADRTEGTEEPWSNLFGAEQYRRREQIAEKLQNPAPTCFETALRSVAFRPSRSA